MENQKNIGGRPAHFDSPEEFEKACLSYIQNCEAEGKPMTITGLAFDLGFESRQSFYDYEKRDRFSYVVKRYRLRIESEYESRLSGSYPAGAIFALKNMGWTDKNETSLVISNELSQEELVKKIAQIDEALEAIDGE